VGVAAAVLLVPGLWADPALHYTARTVAGLGMFGVLAGAVLVRLITIRRPAEGDAGQPAPAGGARRRGSLLWVAPLALVCAQLVPFTVHTVGFATWVRHFEQTVVHTSGPVALDDSGLDPAEMRRYGWAWTNPIMSTVLRENPNQGPIRSSVSNEESAKYWLPNPLPQPEAKFVKRDLLFP